MPKEITQEYLRSLIEYFPETGSFIWKDRTNSQWNGKWSGKEAGWLRKGKGGPYKQVGIDEEKYYAHRLVWLYVYGYLPEQVDHIDGNRLNNKLSNLREAKGSQNHYNKKIMSNNTSGYKGGFYCRQKKKWCARIQVDGKSKHLGFFNCPTAAHISYYHGAKKHHGEFARFA